ncbi:MAG: hypothetical protein WKF75_16265 [Singulisphaera sp.]
MLVVPGPDDFAPVEPITVTFDGTNTKAVTFGVREKSAVKGTVFVDEGTTASSPTARPAGATVYLDANANGGRDAGEPTQLTAADGTYAFRGLQASTYTVGLDTDVQAPAASYAVPAGTLGSDLTGRSVGLSFEVTAPVEITSLGVFDDRGDGLQRTITATSMTESPGGRRPLVFTPGDPGTLVGGSRFKPLARSILLLAASRA